VPSPTHHPIYWVIFFALLVGCDQPQDPDSALNDVYQDDSGRRPATAAEMLWIIFADGCVGQLIAKDQMLTAGHCLQMIGRRFSSGAALQRAGGDGLRAEKDITGGQVLAESPQKDFAIMAVQFRDPNALASQRIVTLASDAAQVQFNAAPGQGDPLFTVGFPADGRGRAMYSDGFAKEIDGHNVRYNVGIINGNSGGAVFRKADGLLVGLTNGGPSMIGQPGWNTKRKDDSNAWNFGVASWCIRGSQGNCAQPPRKLPNGQGPGGPSGFPGGQPGGPGVFPGGQPGGYPDPMNGGDPRAGYPEGGLPPGTIFLPDGGILIPVR
jgi:V8-like Glu-specific endopeptidase